MSELPHKQKKNASDYTRHATTTKRACGACQTFQTLLVIFIGIRLWCAEWIIGIAHGVLISHRTHRLEMVTLMHIVKDSAHMHPQASLAMQLYAFIYRNHLVSLCTRSAIQNPNPTHITTKTIAGQKQRVDKPPRLYQSKGKKIKQNIFFNLYIL